ncbi:3',5'-cyclic-nucleotide phosphodiesterase [Serendipita sp. 399]|nr:3',5'-cyclic-nucleotide phosphodiesterase [Serendipita sp. 399]
MSEAVYRQQKLSKRQWDGSEYDEDEEQGQETRELSLNERWGPVTVLIEKKDVLFANTAAQRASLTPSLPAATTNNPGAHGEGNVASRSSSISLSGNNINAEWESWNSRSSTSTITPNTIMMNAPASSVAVAAISGNPNRRQRTSTTMHASLHVPHSLVASLSSLTIDYVPQELSTTPSSICFPPNATPSPKSIQRALLPLHTVLAQLDAMTRASKGKENARKEVALMVYSDNAHLPPEISAAVFKDGAHGLLTPPFTRASVEHAIDMALEAHANTSAVMDKEQALINHNLLSTQVEDLSYQTPRPSFYSPFQSSPLSFPANQVSQGDHSYAGEEYAPGERDGVDPLDASRPFEFPNSHLKLSAGTTNEPAKAKSTSRSFPVLEPLKERRASVDLGGLALAFSSLPPSLRSVWDPSSPTPSATFQDFDNNDSVDDGSSVNADTNEWRTRTGKGWAGWDTTVASNDEDTAEISKSTGTGRRKGVPPFEEGGELDVAQLVLSMYLQSTSALANASSPLFSAGSNRHQQTLSQSTQTSTSSALSSRSLHHQTSTPNLSTLASANSQLSPPATHTSNTNEFHIPSNSGISFPPSPPNSSLPPSPRHAARLLAQLSSWNFEPYLLNSADTANCVILLFSTLLEAFRIPSDDSGGAYTSQTTSSSFFPSSPTDENRIPLSAVSSLSICKHIAPFVQDLQKLYRKENRYHSFIHALDVLQAVWIFLQAEGRVPPLNPIGAGNRDVKASAGGIGIRTGEDWVVQFVVEGDEEQEGPDRKRVTWRTKAREKTKLGERMNNGKIRKVPSALGLLNDAEVFVLCLAAIGHDVGHPGNGNAFLKNAQTPLSRLYENKSSLERMHCTLLLRLLKKHDMGHLISPLTSQGREGRRLIIGTILATDMSWHFEWLEKFGRAMKERRLRLRFLLQMQPASKPLSTTSPNGGEEIESESEAQTDEPDLVLNPTGDGTWTVKPESPEQRRRISLPARVTVGLADGEDDEEAGSGEGLFRSPEVADREDRLFVCQAIMKCGDISNPCRPHNISRHWSTVLLEEWSAQALLERQLELPVSVASDANEKVQCVGQVSFIKLFTQPLFDTVSSTLDGLYPIARACTDNRVLWEQRMATFDPPGDAQTLSNSIPNSPRGKHTQQMVRPIPLALPIVLPMARYAKTVIPLSLPGKKKTPAESRLLASMSPWQVSAVPMTSGIKAGNGNTSFGSTGNSTSVSGSGTSRVWSRSRPESVSSSSTLSSAQGSTGNGDKISVLNAPRTPTISSSGYGRSPISPVVSPFHSSSGPEFFNFTSATSTSTRGPRRDQQHGSGISSVWDVDPDVRAECEMDLLRSWGKRDGRKQGQEEVNVFTENATSGDLASGHHPLTLRTRTVSLP